MPDITQFTGDNHWLSNFHPAVIEFEGRLYPSVEHAYQAAKVPQEARGVFLRGSAGDAKRLGRKARLPEGWATGKLRVMEQLLELKFKPGSVLAAKLVSTDPCLLIEGNYWGDTYWGICRGKGMNHLGMALMRLRAKLKAAA